MWQAFKKKKRSLWLYAAATFVVLLVITQLLVYQRYRAIRDREHNELLQTLDDKRDQLDVVLEHNLSSAKTISLLYKQTRTLTWFDSVAKELMAMNDAIDVLYFVDKDLVVTHVYPLAGNAAILGFDLKTDPYRAAEAKLALSQDKIVFGGPYDMRPSGEKAIAGRQPLFEGGRFIGGGVVVTKLSTIRKRIPEFENKDEAFVYRLSKMNVLTKKTEYFFDGYRPQKGWEASVFMPRGNWKLYTAYAEGYISHKTLYLLSLFGLLFSGVCALFVYTRTHATEHLEATVATRTHALGERMKELSTIYQVNEILKDERQSIDIAMSRIVKKIPGGWQYPEVCAARIVLDGGEYIEGAFAESVQRMKASLSLQDGCKCFIEVGYCKEMPEEAEGPFLKEERNLINALAEAIEVYYNKKLAGEKVARSEATLRSMVEACPVGVLLMDRDYRIVAINSNMATNYPVNTGRNIGVGDNFMEVLLPERRDSVQNVFNTVMDGLEPVEYDTSYPSRKGGGITYFNVNVAPVVVNAEAIGICLVGIDITRRKQLELEHEHMIRELMNHMTTLVEFARALNDKVRDPLADIPVLSEQAKAEKDEAKRGALLDTISKNALHVAGYVKRLDASLDNENGKKAADANDDHPGGAV